MRSLPNSWNKTLTQLGFRRKRREAPKGSRYGHSVKLGLESLEDRRLLAIAWSNPDSSLNGFDLHFGENSQLATALVNRAIEDWNDVVSSFNFAEDADSDPLNDLDDTFELTVTAEDFTQNNQLGNAARGAVLFADTSFAAGGKPHAARVRLDANGDESEFNSWYFDSDSDDSEFAGVTGPFSANFVFQGDRDDLNVVGLPRQKDQYDIYRTTLHEIGHALGITSNPSAAISGMLQPWFEEASPSNVVPLRNNDGDILNRFESTLPTPQFGVVATFEGGAHLHEGDATDPETALIQVSSGPSTYEERPFVSHPGDVMGVDRIAVGITNCCQFIGETTRRTISDNAAMILADAYDYDVVLPSQLGSLYATLDDESGTLLVQGAAGSSATILVTESAGATTVTVEGIAETFASQDLTQIIIRQGGTDSITVSPGVSTQTHIVNYVVTSNRDDRLDDTPIGDGVADNDLVVSGYQVNVRSAIIDALATGQHKTIYLPPGTYEIQNLLTQDDFLPGFSDRIELGDIEINDVVSLIGASSSNTVIDAAGSLDRIFHIKSGGDLRITNITLRGGEPIPSPFGDPVPTSLNGGAVLVEAGGSLLVENSMITASTAGGAGGAVYSEGSVSIATTTINGNQASGGAAVAIDGGTLSIFDSTLSGNAAIAGDAGGLGGAVLTSSGTISITNSTLSGNSASGDGGAIAALGGSLNVAYSTIMSNSASDVTSTTGGILSSGALTTLSNTIVADSQKAGAAVADVVGSFAGGSEYNLIGLDPAVGNGIDDGLAGSLVGGQGSTSALDVGLSGLVDNGGPTLSHAPLPGSLAINQGDPAAAAGVGSSPLYDQRGVGYGRVVGGTIDIGAIEVQPGPSVIEVIISGSTSLDAPYSFTNAVGSGTQLSTVPVGNADTIAIQFSEEVQVSETDLVVVGTRTGTILLPVSGGFSYDALTQTATWGFSVITVPDQYAISLRDNVTDLAGNRLDGEWVNPSAIDASSPSISTFPSGDGVAGGGFNFVFTALPGDYNRDGKIDFIDFGILGDNYGSSNRGFLEGDTNGNGQVDIIDFGVFANNLGVDFTSPLLLLADLDGDLDVDLFDDPTGIDINGDGLIDMTDIDIALAQFGLNIDTELTA